MADESGLFGDYSNIFSNGFDDFGNMGDAFSYWGGDDYTGGSSVGVPDLAAGYDLISNPNSLQVESDNQDPYNESLISQFGKQIKSPFTRGLANMFGPVGRIAYGTLTQDRSMIPSMFGGIVGNAILPGIGGMLGGWAGSKVNLPSYTGTVPREFGMGDAAQTLMQLYGMSQAGKGLGEAGDMNSALANQVRSLGEIYGPNSPYAAQMRQTLARKDAAAGRNSQYGPREAQLQALLAEKQAQATSAMSQAAQVGNANALAMNKYRNQMTGQKLALASNMAKKFGLFDMFGSGSGRTPNFNPNLGIGPSLVPGSLMPFGSIPDSSSNPLLNWLD